MFLPTTNQHIEAEKARIRRTYQKIEEWTLTLIPVDLRTGLDVNVQEIQCGDPNCAPIDTVITLMFESGQNPMIGLPMEAAEVTLEELRNHIPTVEYLQKWHAGEEADWPPEPEFDESQMPKLRFDLGQRVQCRVGPTEWHSGTIIQLWYRENTWPPGSYAPYKIKLDDGRNIFAPGDLEQIIRREER